MACFVMCTAPRPPIPHPLNPPSPLSARPPLYPLRAMATMYELNFRDTATTTTTAAAAAVADDTSPALFTIARIAEAVNLTARLADRERLPPRELDAALEARSAAHSLASGGGNGGSTFVPGFPVERLFPGAFYLERVGLDRTRVYGRRPKDGAARARGGVLAPALALEEEEEEREAQKAAGGEGGEGEDGGGLVDKAAAVAAAGGGAGPGVEEEGATTATTASGTDDASVSEGDEEGGSVGNGAPSSGSQLDVGGAPSGKSATVGGGPPGDAGLDGNGADAADAAAAAVAAVALPLGGAVAVGSAAKLLALLPRVVVTGVACGLPGQEKVFEEDNLARLLAGQGCVERLSAASVAALLDKKVVQVGLVGGWVGGMVLDQ